ncbi:regulator [Streptomyces eurocidicus]|uniref:Regulator n=1 Tax=Streptomyces eurocidicus TaxID=66423 RepID=A0A2N8NVD3_STREU|nr:TetR/AcrR family transcriptional regulator C-terminal domain-containing protein [Streptomyces eurocidicus]MBB5122969.1 AcrR family transcriptional regulator [Streptomyces eurocidicus]PNE32740.1 regulator [Streptomyces eurocidicus]
MARGDASDAPRVDPEELWLRPARPRRGRPPAFSREVIAAAAVALADAEGLGGVTMRRVASEIGAGAMSLYSYVPDKETLVELMIDHVSGEHVMPGLPTGDWRADLKAVAHAQRALMLRHPWLPAALPGRRTLGPRTLAVLEVVLAALRPSRLDGGARLEVFSLLTGFVAGHVAHEVAQSAVAGEPDRAAAEARYLAAVAADGRHPELAGVLAGPARPTTPDETFARLLDRMVNGLDAG